MSHKSKYLALEKAFNCHRVYLEKRWLPIIGTHYISQVYHLRTDIVGNGEGKNKFTAVKNAFKDTLHQLMDKYENGEYIHYNSDKEVIQRIKHLTSENEKHIRKSNSI